MNMNKTIKFIILFTYIVINVTSKKKFQKKNLKEEDLGFLNDLSQYIENDSNDNNELYSKEELYVNAAFDLYGIETKEINKKIIHTIGRKGGDI